MPVAILMPFTATPSRKSVSASSFRLTEKFVLLLVFSAFITFCFGAIFFLPDSSKLFFFRSDPAVEGDTRTGTDGDSGVGGGGGFGVGGTGKDEQILAKIRRDHEQALHEAKDTLQKRPDEIKQDIRSEKDIVMKNRGAGLEKEDGSLPLIEYVRAPGATAREPSDPETREKRAKIKEVNKHPSPILILFTLLFPPRVKPEIPRAGWCKCHSCYSWGKLASTANYRSTARAKFILRKGTVFFIKPTEPACSQLCSSPHQLQTQVLLIIIPLFFSPEQQEKPEDNIYYLIHVKCTPASLSFHLLSRETHIKTNMVDANQTLSCHEIIKPLYRAGDDWRKGKEVIQVQH